MHFAALTLALVAAVASGCSRSTQPVPDLPTFHDITGATPAIQSAASAVVRIHTAGAYATGSFISSGGILLTNNHVLGAPVCAKEGCFAELTFMRQRGQPRQAATLVFVKPIAVDIGLDMAIVQVLASPNGSPLSTPSFLTWSAHDAASLEGTHVTVVGHPHGKLKKWTDGVVTDPSGQWFKSSAYILPGDSGSPVLDDAGEIVGIIHRAPTGEDLFTSTGAEVYSIGTASAPLMAAMNAPLPSALLSTAAATTKDAVVASERIYLNAGVATVNVSEKLVSVVSLLADACDAALAKEDYASLDELAIALAPCRAAAYWIECRADATKSPYPTVCPEASELAAWNARYHRVSERQRAMNGQLDYASLSFSIAPLSASKSDGDAAAAASLRAALDATAPTLDFTLAYYLCAYGIDSYSRQSMVDYIRNYARVVRYDLDATNIAAAATWLGGTGAIAKDEVQTILAQLASDPKIGIGSKLFIEDLQLSWGFLQ